MTITVRETTRRYRYLGIELPAPPGMTPDQVKDLHSTLYPELVSADIELGEIVAGVQDVTFKRAVGTKGTRLQRLRQAVSAIESETAGASGQLASALTVEEVALCSSIWERCARSGSREDASANLRHLPEWR